MGRHDEWVARDATVVWHGFTQMDAFAENAPVLVERGEGHELIDVDGRRYLDAISSLWVNTLGHAVPELDDAVHEQLERGAHSTMLGNGNVAVVELAEALARVVPVDDPHFLFASDGAAAVEQALKIAFQYWVNRRAAGHTQFLAFGGTRTTATPLAHCRWATPPSAPTCSTRCAFPCCGHRSSGTPDASTPPSPWSRRTPTSSRR